MDPHIFTLDAIGAFIDDSISMIKLKISSHIKSRPAVEELYICLKTEERINIRMLYNMLSLNNTLPVTRKSLTSYCDIILEKIDIPKHVDIFTIDDFYTIFDDTKKYSIIKPLGNHITQVSNIRQTEYIVFPPIPDIGKQIPSSIYSSTEFNTDLLIQYITDINDVETIKLYVYLATDLVEKYNRLEISLDEFVKLYYPRLYYQLNKGTGVNIEHIKDLHSDLSERTKSLYEINRPYFTHISAFNSIPSMGVPYSYGITRMHMMYINSLNTIFPMDYIFKTLHATELMPCIKYRKNSKSEQFIRMYQPSSIPAVSKAYVIKMLNVTGKTPGITAFIPIDKYAYINAIDVVTNPNMMLFLHINSYGNISVYYETTCKYIISYRDLIPIIKSVMGFFAGVINETILSYYQKIPTAYPLLSGVELNILDLQISVIYSDVTMASIVKVLSLLPAIFSQGENDSSLSINSNIGLYTLGYNKSQNYIPDSPESTNITITNDKVSNKIIWTVSKIPSILYLPLIMNYLSKFITIAKNADLYNNYSNSCVPGYSTFTDISTPYSKQSQLNDGMYTNIIPISTIYSSIDTGSEEPETSTMEDTLKHLEFMLVHNTVANDNKSTTLHNNELPFIDDLANEISMEDEMDLGDMGW